MERELFLGKCDYLKEGVLGKEDILGRGILWKEDLERGLSGDYGRLCGSYVRIMWRELSGERVNRGRGERGGTGEHRKVEKR